MRLFKSVCCFIFLFLFNVPTHAANNTTVTFLCKLQCTLFTSISLSNTFDLVRHFIYVLFIIYVYTIFFFYMFLVEPLIRKSFILWTSLKTTFKFVKLYPFLLLSSGPNIMKKKEPATKKEISMS